jgi:hypothetical protein
MVDRLLSVKARGVLRSPAVPSLRAPLLVIGSVASAVLATACPAYMTPPCFPAASATPVDIADGGFTRQTLAWEIDKMAALVDVPNSDLPPSETFMRAQRDMRTEFWPDAAREFLAVVRGDTKDGKTVRRVAQYDFALSLFRLRYFEEAKRVFGMIAADPKHPMNSQADDWMQRKVCSG